ncbi:uncharacterized protein LOC135682309 [Rhopilema esculentum]|uniref:uncharacterized protein LOC135682309 n=1 Tax=Rhopilema esculentum TaxID=499914 RepID=UPI0031DCAC04
MEGAQFTKLFCIVFLTMLGAENINTAEDCIPVDQCSCKLKSGKYISLWDIDKKGASYPAEDALSRTGFNYLYSPCSVLKKTGTECDNALVCQNVNSDSFAIALKPKAVSVGYDVVLKQYTFVYTGTSTQLSKNRQTTINLACDPNIKAPLLSVVLESPEGVYGLTVTTKCACPGACSHLSPQSASSSTGLSTGSVLCIVLLVLVVVYLIGGVLINKFVRHEENSELFPNKTFWKGFPVLVKDGCIFTFRKIRAGKSDYEAIS